MGEKQMHNPGAERRGNAKARLKSPDPLKQVV
jgi:hypothetical protein